MTPRESFNTVVKMREAQKSYFRTRSAASLAESKNLEKKIDDEIQRVRILLTKKK